MTSFAANLDKWRAISDTVKNWMQIVGLVFGGVWVVMTFGLQSCPSREKQLDGTSALEWSAGPTPDTCILSWDITVSNPTTRSIRIRRADVNVWEYQPLRRKDGGPALVDTERFRPKTFAKYLFHKSFSDRIDSFVDPYPPRGTAEEEFQWVFTRPAGRQQWIVVELELYESKSDRLPLWFISRTTEVCGRSDEE